SPQPATARLWDVNPNMAIALLTGKCGGINARRVERILAGEGRDFPALPRHRLEGPAVILASHLPTVKPPVGERNATMRTGIAHGEVFSDGSASQHQRNAQQHGFRHALAADGRR